MISRIVLVTRSFWPRTGGAETLMGRFALELQQRGVAVKLFTAQGNPSWPIHQDWNGIELERIPQPSLRGWGTFRYMQQLYRALAGQVGVADLVYVSMLKHDAWVAWRALRHTSIPVVLRAEGGGRGGDAQWQATHPLGPWIRRACQQADAIVTPSRQIAEELTARGYAAGQLHAIPNGVPLPPPRLASTRVAARRTLATSSQHLAAMIDDPWVVYTGRLVHAKGLADLIVAWNQVEQEFPRAKLLLVGEGPDQRALGDLIQARGLSESVCLPGSFPDVQDFLGAADLFVLPSYEEGLSLALLEALAAELPAVGTDIPGIREILAPLGPEWLVPPRQPADLAERIQAWLRDAGKRSDAARIGRIRVARDYALENVMDFHWNLFQTLLDRKRGPACRIASST